jgi:hypothetical protein
MIDFLRLILSTVIQPKNTRPGNSGNSSVKRLRYLREFPGCSGFSLRTCPATHTEHSNQHRAPYSSTHTFYETTKLLVTAKAAKSAEETSVWNDFMRPILYFYCLAIVKNTIDGMDCQDQTIYVPLIADWQ